jgi:uncharacterized protein YndB with AHSA1/START domain
MKHLENRLHFQAPIERVFDLATDPSRWTEYMPWVSDVRDVQGRGDTVGDRATFTDHAGPGMSLDATAVVTEVERPNLQVTETTYEDRSRMVIRMEFLPVGDGTDIVSSVDYEVARGGIVAAARELVTEPFIERRMREMGENFGKILEPIRT